MELWIRSQDRGSLIKADNLGLFGNRIVFIPNRPTGGRMTIGRYKTEERALEVLDEIQELFEPTTITLDGKYMETRQLDAFVYEMPEK